MQWKFYQGCSTLGPKCPNNNLLVVTQAQNAKNFSRIEVSTKGPTAFFRQVAGDPHARTLAKLIPNQGTYSAKGIDSAWVNKPQAYWDLFILWENHLKHRCTALHTYTSQIGFVNVLQHISAMVVQTHPAALLHSSSQYNHSSYHLLEG